MRRRLLLLLCSAAHRRGLFLALFKRGLKGGAAGMCPAVLCTLSGGQVKSGRGIFPSKRELLVLGAERARRVSSWEPLAAAARFFVLHPINLGSPRVVLAHYLSRIPLTNQGSHQRFKICPLVANRGKCGWLNKHLLLLKLMPDARLPAIVYIPPTKCVCVYIIWSSPFLVHSSRGYFICG